MKKIMAPSVSNHDIVCDSSSIITLASNGFLHLFKDFTVKGSARFFIPLGVRKEIVDAPLTTRRFKFAAIRVMEVIDSGWLRIIDESNTKQLVHSTATRIMERANSVLLVKNRPIRILQFGEAEALALAKVMGAPTILIDERATRLMIEDPAALQETIEKRTGKTVAINRNALKELEDETEGLRVIRSAELAIIALERGLLDFQLCEAHRNDLNARNELLLGMLYALKDAGCALKESEINEYFRSEHPTI